ncbi:MAG: TylF/MycF/NovP-related O-methyltransferase [Vicinamibacterales bacterium]
MRFIRQMRARQASATWPAFAAHLQRLGRPELAMDAEGAARLAAMRPADFAAMAEELKAFNQRNPLVRMSFAFDALNDEHGIRDAYPFWAKEHMLHGFMTSEEQAVNLWHLLRAVLAAAVPGEVAELGCHEGLTAALLQHTIDETGGGRQLHVFDSFEGLPPPTAEDARGEAPVTRAGELAVAEARLHETFARFGLRPPVVHKGWFDQTLHDLPDALAFVHLDADLYASTATALAAVYPRLSRGAIVVLDDYHDPDEVPCRWSLFPGVKRAADEFLADKPERVVPLLAGHECHGFFTKQ